MLLPGVQHARVRLVNTRLRSRLGGKGARNSTNEIPRYRHKPGTRCGCQNRSVRCDLYEADFAHLIQLLTVKPEAANLMTELAIQADMGSFHEDVDMEKQKGEAVTLCYRRIDAAIHLYKDGEINRAEYPRIRETNEREIAHWQSRTTETQRLAVELALCIEAVDKLSRLWEISSPEDRRGLAQSLFEFLTYDLDAQRITDFRLKPWADRFLIVRANLIDSGNGAGHEEKGDTIEEDKNSLLRAGYGYAPKGA